MGKRVVADYDDTQFLPIRRCIQCAIPFEPPTEQDDWCDNCCYERWLRAQGECGE